MPRTPSISSGMAESSSELLFMSASLSMLSSELLETESTELLRVEIDNMIRSETSPRSRRSDLARYGFIRTSNISLPA